MGNRWDPKTSLNLAQYTRFIRIRVRKKLKDIIRLLVLRG